MMTFIENYWDALVEMFAEMAPYLILGFFFAGLLKAFVPQSVYSQHLAPRTMGSVIKAAALGVGRVARCVCEFPDSNSTDRRGFHSRNVFADGIAVCHHQTDSGVVYGNFWRLAGQ